MRQAQKVVQRWQPWWHTPEAAALRLTERGTAPLTPLAPGAAASASAAAQQASPAEAAPAAQGAARNQQQLEALDAVEEAPAVLPDPPWAPLPPLPRTAGHSSSPLIRHVPCQSTNLASSAANGVVKMPARKLSPVLPGNELARCTFERKKIRFSSFFQ